MRDLYDLIIVGGGPAGLSAAIYMARAKYSVLVLEREKIGGQITITEEVVNYPGIQSVSGEELTQRMRMQAESFGAEFATGNVTEMELNSDIKTVTTENGNYKTLSVIVAVGANPRKVGFKGEKEFQGRGVAYCATCDGEFFSGMNIFVIGGGFAAVEEGIFLTKYAKHVTICVRGDHFSCARSVSDKLNDVRNISVRFNTEIVEVSGNDRLEKAVLKNNLTNSLTTYNASEEGDFGVFVFAGYVPNTSWLPKEIALSDDGYILTDNNKATNISGVYGAGDVCVKNLRQLVTAVSDGAIAATSAEKYVSAIHEKLNISQTDVKRKTSIKPQTTIIQDFLDEQIKQQLKDIFEKFDNPVVLKLWLDDDSELSPKIEKFAHEVSALDSKISITYGKEGTKPSLMPSIEICRFDGKTTNAHFHGIPGGHEINSFVMALYNASGNGREIDEATRKKIKAINDKTNIKILVTLSCSMCPEAVMSAQRIASLNDNVTAEMADISYYPQLKAKYRVMSVPCIIINDEKVSFGKKNISQLLDTIEE